MIAPHVMPRRQMEQIKPKRPTFVTEVVDAVSIPPVQKKVNPDSAIGLMKRALTLEVGKALKVVVPVEQKNPGRVYLSMINNMKLKKWPLKIVKRANEIYLVRLEDAAA